MKSYFSRFLHHTLSHSGIREVFTSSLSLSDLIGESRSNKVANLSHLDYRVKPDNDGKVRVGQVWVCYNFLHDRRQAERYVRRSGDR